MVRAMREAVRRENDLTAYCARKGMVIIQAPGEFTCGVKARTGISNRSSSVPASECRAQRDPSVTLHPLRFDRPISKEEMESVNAACKAAGNPVSTCDALLPVAPPEKSVPPKENK